MLKGFKHILNTSHILSLDFSFGARFYKSCFSSRTTYENNTYEQLEALKFPGLVIYVNKDNIEKYQENILKYFNTNVIGFDTEFIIDINEKENNNENRSISCYIKNGKDNNYINSQLINIFKKKKKNYAYNLCNNEKNKILCLIQLCSSDLCFVFNIHKLNGHIPISVKNILENEEIIKVAHDIKNEKDMFLSNNIQIKNVFDLYNYAIDNFIYPPSLQSLVKIYLNKFLDKKFRLSNWLNYSLLQEQILYAAVDAYASRQIYFHLDENKKKSQSYILNYILQENQIKSCYQKFNKYTYKKKDLNNENIIKIEEKNIQNIESINNTIHNQKKKNNINNQHQNEYDSNIKQLQSFYTHNNQNKKNYEFVEKYKLQLINSLKNEIHNKCTNMTNISFVQEMTFTNNTYKNILSLKHNQNNYNFIKFSSVNYDEEINSCYQILTYLDQTLCT